MYIRTYIHTHPQQPLQQLASCAWNRNLKDQDKKSAIHLLIPSHDHQTYHICDLLELLLPHLGLEGLENIKLGKYGLLF